MQLKIYLLALKEGFAEGLCLAQELKGAGVRMAAHKRRCAFAQGGQQTTGQGQVAIVFSRAVVPVTGCRRSSASGRAAWARREGSDAADPAIAGAPGQGVIACRARVITSLGVA
jgi:hypothetical protein